MINIELDDKTNKGGRDKGIVVHCCKVKYVGLFNKSTHLIVLARVISNQGKPIKNIIRAGPQITALCFALWVHWLSQGTCMQVRCIC